MKKNLLRSCSLMILAVLFGVVSVQAQTLGAYEADIPFDFTIGDTDYLAGDYVIRVKSPNYLATILEVSNGKGMELQSTALAKSGERSKNDQARLVFDRDGDNYVLREIVAPGFGFATRKFKDDVTAHHKEGSKPNPDTVSIVLKRRE